MTKILKNLVIACFLFLVTLSPAAVAQESFSLSITPALFQMSLGPGETWNGELKIINTNTHDLTVFATPMNFKAGNERGRPQFIPITEEDPNLEGATLASWMDITQDPINIPVQQSAEVPFSISLPEDASPGGHYAAILVGTQPVKQGEGPATLVSSYVSSLLFVRVQGDITEDGFIREFSAEKEFYQQHEVDFTVNFENTGNVHIRPQGDVTIYNMWGKKRGVVPINQAAGFGNVLPGSSREFSFEWKGEPNIFDIGRYKADITLTFGESARQSKTSTINFWVVPLKSTLGMLGGFLGAILLAVFSIRWYIQRAFKLQAAALGINPETLASDKKQETPSPLQGKDKGREEKIKPKTQILQPKNLKKNYKFLVITSVVLISIVAGIFFFRAALLPERSFEIIIERQGTNTGVQLDN